MPSYDDYTAVLGLRENSRSGRKRSWINTPNYGSIPKDEKPVNRYDDRHIVLSQDTYYAKRTHKGNGSVYYAVNPTPYFTNAVLDQMTLEEVLLSSGKSIGDRTVAVENESKALCLGKISNAKVNLAVAAAEAQKTADLILGTANRIDRAYRAFRRGDFAQVARLLNITPGRVHKTWLEYKYGWTPLLSDVKGAAEFFAQKHVGRPVQFTVISNRKHDASGTRRVTYTPYGGLPTSTITHRFTLHNECKTKIWCEITNSRLSELQQLGLTNPLLVAWELVPYSFVFDWFLQVGQWLEGLTAFDGIRVKRVWQTSWFECRYERETPPTVRSDATYTYEESSLNIKNRIRQFGRGVPSLDPTALTPLKGKPLSFEKMITSLALLRGNYGSARI